MERSPPRSPLKSFTRYGELPDDIKQEIALRSKREDIGNLYQTSKGIQPLLQEKSFLEKHGARSKPLMKQWIDDRSYSIIIGYLGSVEGDSFHGLSEREPEGIVYRHVTDWYEEPEYIYPSDWIAYAAREDSIAIVSTFLKDGRLDPFGKTIFSLEGAIHEKNIAMFNLLMSDERMLDNLEEKVKIMVDCLYYIGLNGLDDLGIQILGVFLDNNISLLSSGVSYDWIESCISSCPKTCIFAIEKDPSVLGRIYRTLTDDIQPSIELLEYMAEKKHLTNSSIFAEKIIKYHTVKELRYFIDMGYVDLNDEMTGVRLLDISKPVNINRKREYVMQEFLEYLLSFELSPVDFNTCMINSMPLSEDYTARTMTRLLEDERSDFFFESVVPKQISQRLFSSRNSNMEAIVILKNDSRTISVWGDKFTDAARRNPNKNIRSLFA